MQLTFEAAQEIHDRDVAHAWIGRDFTGQWQIVVVEWTPEMRLFTRKQYTALYEKNSHVLTGEQARAITEVLRFKAEHGEDLSGVTLEV